MAIVTYNPFSLSRWPSVWDWDEEDTSVAPTSNLDVYETDQEVIIQANVAGVSEKDIDLTFEKGVLWVRALTQKDGEDIDQGRKYYRKASRSYSYKVAVPGNVDLQKEPQAALDQGILTVTFHKTEVAKPKRIEVKKSKKANK